MPRRNLSSESKTDFNLVKLRNVLDPHRHYRSSKTGASAPEFSQIGQIIEGPTEYFSSRLTSKERKSTLVEEVLATEAITGRFKKKYKEIQASKTSGKKAYYKKSKARRHKITRKFWKSWYLKAQTSHWEFSANDWSAASALSGALVEARAVHEKLLEFGVFSAHGIRVRYLQPAGSLVAMAHNPQLMPLWLKIFCLTCTSLAAFLPASSTSSWFALPLFIAFAKSRPLVPWIWISSPRGPASSNALFVTRLIANTLMSQCRATMISGTVDIPTTSAPKLRNMRHSALVS